MERGSALLEVLAVGFFGMILVGQSTVTVGRLATAGAIAEEAAHLAAVVAADSGDIDRAEEVARAVAPGATVTTTDVGEAVTVAVRIDVALVGPSSGPVTMAVHGEATVARSPYRSGP